ncbi:cell wall protein PhiA [Daldinia decipiens]|uniref:cell wall protein PhiA n=1 Tax=Daldinia decipiens TaxID=326647 RepID=UPI0020C57A2B|nr:cell wall protein PhiA [Daldinia decipiens]KAI1658571.1 cell wall protein PhiA [Daldinia decipiens]
MFFKNLALAAPLFAGASTALPQAAPGAKLSPDAKFSLMALRSGSEVHFASFEAAKGSVFVKLPSQNASCDAGAADHATFYLQDGGLYLYAASATPQQLYADRSGMGQGKLGYTTGAQPAPSNGERTSFALDENNDLTVNGAGFLACPNSIDGAWSVWVSTGVEKPAGNQGCLGISARAVEAANPNGCLYTQ